MINKNFIHFNQKSDFLTELNKGNIQNTSIIFIKDTKQIYTHGEYYNCDIDLDGFATEEYVRNLITATLGNIDKILDNINGEII